MDSENYSINLRFLIRLKSNNHFIMKKLILTALSVFALVSCGGNLNPDNGEDGNNPSDPIIGKVSGVAQKGQLAKGSQVTAFALDENLIATGESFPANISDDLGSFSVSGKTTAPYLELRAEGYYFNEVSGSVTDAPIYLEAVVPSSETDANLNIFTTLTKGRIKTIIASGKKYDDAKKQAQEELAKALGLSIIGTDFEDLDITKNSESNAFLLYVACMIQNNRAISGITTAIQSAAAEFEKEGTLSSANVERLLQPSSQLDVPKIISNLQTFYTANNNATAQIPPFWKYAGEQWQSPFIFIEDGATSIGPSYPEGMEPADEISFSYKILATDDFKIESDQSWITFTKDDTKAPLYSVSGVVSKNESPERRIGHLLFKSENGDVLDSKEFVQGPNSVKLLIKIATGDTKSSLSSSVNEPVLQDGSIVGVNGKEYSVKRYDAEYFYTLVDESDSYVIEYPAGKLRESDYYARIAVNYDAEVSDSFTPLCCCVRANTEYSQLGRVINVELENVMSAMRITLNGYENVGHITMSGNDSDDYFAGVFTYPMYPNDVMLDPKLDPNTKKGDIKELIVNETDGDNVLYFAVPPVTFPSGITLKVFDKSGNLLDTKVANREMDFKRGYIFAISATKN